MGVPVQTRSSTHEIVVGVELLVGVILARDTCIGNGSNGSAGGSAGSGGGDGTAVKGRVHIGIVILIRKSESFVARLGSVGLAVTLNVALNGIIATSNKRKKHQRGQKDCQ